MDLKLTPDCIEIPIPRYFREDDKKRIDERNFLIDELLMEYHDTKEPEVEEFEDRFMLQQDIDVALQILARNERGRQGIERALKAKSDKREEDLKAERLERLKLQNDGADEQNEETDAIIIKKYWRGK